MQLISPSVRRSVLRVAQLGLAAIALAGILPMNGQPESPRALSNHSSLQSVLDQGGDLLLDPNSLHVVDKTLRYTRPGQRIATHGAATPAQFATLQMAPGSTMTLIDGAQQSGVVLERVILDGKRETMEHTDGKVPGLPMTSWGKQGGDRQIVRQCLIFDARCGGGWGAIHIHEGGFGILIEDNVIIGAGVDARGNGRSNAEQPFGWGDGISTASRDTIIRNNLIVDATDDGIMVQGAPGTLVENNVIAAISREMLGGIALIDPFRDYEMPGGGARFDYTGVIVRENRIDASGAWIHIGFPMGGASWNKRLGGAVLVGATIKDNTLSGEAFGYGFVANGIDDFTVRGNKSQASHSGRGDGLRETPPDPAAPFLFDPDHVGSSELQSEFQPKKAHLVSLLRNRPPPADALGYRLESYGVPEASGVVRMAFIEMLGRAPDPTEMKHWIEWLQHTKSTGDALRQRLMASREFIDHPPGAGTHLQSFRLSRWERAVVASWDPAMKSSGDGSWPKAHILYAKVIADLAAGVR